MSLPAIKVEGLWKEYTVGAAQQRHGTFYDLLAHSLKTPFNRLSKFGGHTPDTENFWALRDVNFEIQSGEVVGVIGSNGAGKSTLLKILSRITAPTKGCITVRGRLASLLEVGTGFHPELSGRENIFLNGAILGMSRNEVAQKFDEIVAFAEIEKFIDTPVKRYSSGMYVRLAFAVAAHLEPDILVIDEVLAVGDADFQKRCLGKIKEVSSGGRTVIFVSHNTTAVQALCNNCILMNRGLVDSTGPTNIVIDKYLATTKNEFGFVHTDLKFINLLSTASEYKSVDGNRCSVTVELKFKCSISAADIHIDFGLENSNDVRFIQAMPKMRGDKQVEISADGVYLYKIQWDSTSLAPGSYFCTLHIQSKSLGIIFHSSKISLFSVTSTQSNMECMSAGFTAVLLPTYTSTLNKLS